MLNRVSLTATEEATPRPSLFGSLTIDAYVLFGMLGLTFLGVAITYVNRDLSYHYWFAMVPVFATICFIAQYSHKRNTAKWTSLLLTQILHWGGLLLAVELVYTLLNAGNIPRATTGMITLLLFALVTFLYGVHLDRRFMGIGVFLGFSYIVMSYLAAYIWILLLIAVLFIAIAVFLLKRAYAKQAAAAPAMTPPPPAGEDAVRSAWPGEKARESSMASPGGN